MPQKLSNDRKNEQVEIDVSAQTKNDKLRIYQLSMPI